MGEGLALAVRQADGMVHRGGMSAARRARMRWPGAGPTAWTLGAACTMFSGQPKA